jgi:alkanesulfonate monooxygenase
MRLRFHWSLSQVGDKFRRTKRTAEMSGLLSLNAQIEFCRAAEESGIESVLMAFGFTRPDPVALSAALGMATTKMKFMIACRSGICSPVLFVQQVNTISALTHGRVSINMVTGHSPQELRYYGDFLEHDDRYARTREFLTVCRMLWENQAPITFRGHYYQVEDARVNTPFVSDEGSGPEIYLGGNSHMAEELALDQAHCLWRFPNRPEELRPCVQSFLDRGKEVGLLVSLLARPTRKQAHKDAYAMLAEIGDKAKTAHRDFAEKSDSVGFRRNFQIADRGEEWLTPCLWTGAIPYLGPPAIALVGSYEDIASAILEYQEIGISQFLFMGWPDLDEMKNFSREILPLLRSRKSAVGTSELTSGGKGR